MKKISLNDLEKNLDKCCDECICNNEKFLIQSKAGNVVMINEKEYNDLILKIDVLVATSTQTSEFIKTPPWYNEN